jgi:AraC family transcriptional regulator, exoenzyme S synthesis regulatory protein ExsA
MENKVISNCYITPSPSTEQYIPNHTFMYLVAGSITVYDGSKVYNLKSGDYGIGKRNHLARYTKQANNGDFRKIYITFEQEFLKEFNQSYHYIAENKEPTDTLIRLKENKLIDNFIQSLMPYFNEKGIIDGEFLQVKRIELLLVLLKTNPTLKNVFFNFNIPEKIDLETFMTRNYKFNVRLERFALLTGRSLSAFKRDFKKIFNTNPSYWLIQKRLEEAYFLIDIKNKKPTEIYLDLGFENLSHFSFAFKKNFWLTPTELTGQNKNTSR